MKAVILAAGVGSRLAPLTNDRPKVLVEVLGKPIIFRQLDHLAAAGIASKDVVVVYLDNGELASTTPDGKKTVNASTFGQAKFNPRDRTHSEMLVKGAQRVIAVELK